METSFDPARAARFAERMLGALNGAALALMISIGHRTGLFDVMRDLAPAAPTRDRAAGRARRALRARVARRDGDRRRRRVRPRGRHVPPARPSTPPRSRAPRARTTSPPPPSGSRCSARVEDEIVELLRARRRRALLVLRPLPRGDGRGERPDRGGGAARAHPAARARAARALARGIDVLDVGCGSGRALARMAGAFPNSRFTGFDLSARARSRARASRRARSASRTCASRCATSRTLDAAGPLRPGHRLRRHPRPGAAGRRAREHRARAAPRRRLPDAGHRRHQPRARGRARTRSRPSSTRSRACTA